MGLVITWAIITLVELGKASTAILQENYRSILAAESMTNAIERQDSGLLFGFIGQQAEGEQLFQENKTEFLHWLDQASNNVTLADEPAIIHTVDSVYTVYLDQVSRSQLLQTSAIDTARAFYAHTLYPAFRRIRRVLSRLRNINQEAMYQASRHARDVATRAIWSTAGVGMVSISLGFLLSMFISRQITRPVKRLMQAAKGLATGDYQVRVESGSRDELGQLAAEFNRMAGELERYHHLNIEHILEEKHKSEAILGSIEDGIIVINRQEQVMNMNRSAEHLFHVRVPHTEPGFRIDTLLHDPALLEHIHVVLHSGSLLSSHDERQVISLEVEGKTRYFSYSVTPYHGLEQQLIGVVIHLTDVTRLKELDRLKSEFVLTASHELRTPLTSIGMSIGLLKEHAREDMEPPDRELLDAAYTEVHRLKSLVNDLLDLSRIETGQLSMKFQPVRPSLFSEHIESIFTTQLVEKTVSLEMAIPQDLPLVRADANKITWVISNLVSNALRYVDRGGHIWFEATREGHVVQFAVRDDGPGIPLEYQTKIFQKFVQLDTTDETEGTGLGLAICKEIIQAHGGTIWVESREGEGSTFFFTLPMYRSRQTA